MIQKRTLSKISHNTNICFTTTLGWVCSLRSEVLSLVYPHFKYDSRWKWVQKDNASLLQIIKMTQHPLVLKCSKWFLLHLLIFFKKLLNKKQVIHLDLMVLFVLVTAFIKLRNHYCLPLPSCHKGRQFVWEMTAISCNCTLSLQQWRCWRSLWSP